MTYPLDISLVTHNSSRWLTAFFESLSKQTYPTHLLNIYIHDNHSDDNTVELLRNIKSTYQHHFGQFEITEGPNNGFGYGHNRNFEKTHADYFLVTNPDIRWEENTLTELVRYITPDFASFELRQKPYEHPKYYNPVTLETHWSSSACVLFRRDAFKKINGYEERIFLYGEDVEISYRLRDHGYKLKYCPRAVCWHYTYEHERQIKPTQFFGSKLANLYIRLRYGTSIEIITGFIFYVALFFIPKKVPHKFSGLFKNFIHLIKNTSYFLKTRKISRTKFSFKLWDYDVNRAGAFFENKSLPLSSLPLVSVVIRTYQGRLTVLKDAVASVRHQTYPNIELIIIEDGSYTAENIFPEAKYCSIEKSGRCAAGNKGLSLATGDYIVFLDDDDLFFTDHIEILVSTLLENPDKKAAYSIAWEIENINATPRITHQQPFSRELLRQRNYFPIQSVLFHRELYETYGGFDESLDALEDWDLWLRYTEKNDFIFVKKVTSIYHISTTYRTVIKREKHFQTYYPVLLRKHPMLIKRPLHKIVKKLILCSPVTYYFFILLRRLKVY